MDELEVLPFFTETKFVLVAFIALLVIFDIIFVRLIKLSKKEWKKVDYIWLGFASLGLFGSVYDSRSTLAPVQASVLQSRMNWQFHWIHRTIESKLDGVVCREFVRTEFSPPPEEFEQIEQGFDATCNWFKQVSTMIPANLSDVHDSIDIDAFPQSPHFDGTLVDINDLGRAISDFNATFDNVKKLQDKSVRSDFENSIVVLSPLLLMVALAIRITKVTGEVRLEQN